MHARQPNKKGAVQKDNSFSDGPFDFGLSFAGGNSAISLRYAFRAVVTRVIT